MSCTYTASGSILGRAPRTWTRRTPPSLAPEWWRSPPAWRTARSTYASSWSSIGEQASGGVHAQRGVSVAAYTYWVGCVDPAIDLHYDLDPVRHPPATTVIRRPCGPATPRRALQAALQLAADIERVQAQGLNAAADIVDSLDLGDYVP